MEAIFAVEPKKMAPLVPIMEEAGLPLEDELILSREIFSSGRSVSRVNGRAVPLFLLKKLGQHLVDLHGQHEHQSLLNPRYHLALLDDFGGEELNAARKKVADSYRRWQELNKQWETLGRDSGQRERRIDMLNYQINEITAAGLEPGEEEELATQEKILAHSERLSTCLLQAYTDLFAGDGLGRAPAVADRLPAAGNLVERPPFDPALAPLAASLEVSPPSCRSSPGLKMYIDNIVFDPAELGRVQERLA